MTTRRLEAVLPGSSVPLWDAETPWPGFQFAEPVVADVRNVWRLPGDYRTICTGSRSRSDEGRVRRLRGIYWKHYCYIFSSDYFVCVVWMVYKIELILFCLSPSFSALYFLTSLFFVVSFIWRLMSSIFCLQTFFAYLLTPTIYCLSSTSFLCFIFYLVSSTVPFILYFPSYIFYDLSPVFYFLFFFHFLHNPFSLLYVLLYFFFFYLVSHFYSLWFTM